MERAAPFESSSGNRRSARALTGGFAGTVILTGLHEAARHLLPHAPRMDVIGERALARLLARVRRRVVPREQLFGATLAGEIVSNTVYYSLIGAGSRSGLLRRGLLIGLAAGVGAVLLPPRLGLGSPPREKRPVTPLLTIVWYTAGGVTAALAMRLWDGSGSRG